MRRRLVAAAAAALLALSVAALSVEQSSTSGRGVIYGEEAAQSAAAPL